MLTSCGAARPAVLDKRKPLITLIRQILRGPRRSASLPERQTVGGAAAQWDQVADTFADLFPKVTAMMRKVRTDVLAFRTP